MKQRLFISLHSLLVCVAAFPYAAAQERPRGPSPREVKYWPAHELQEFPAKLLDMFEKAPKDRVPYSHGASPQRMLMPHFDSNYYVDVIMRTQSGLAEWHDTKSDFYVVLDGQAKAVVGGEMPDKKQLADRPEEWRSETIVGGQQYPLKKGDMLNIPSKTPHQIIIEPGKSITYVMIKIID